MQPGRKYKVIPIVIFEEVIMMLKKFFSVALSLSLAASFAGSAFAGETEQEVFSAEVVNIAIQPSAAFVPLYYAKEMGWIEEALSEYGVEVVWNEFESGPPMNESLASGSSDIGVVGDVPIVSAIAAGQENQLIALTCDAPLSYNLLVSPDSDIASVADLKGKKVATVVGSTAHNLVDKLLTSADLTMADIELVNISAGDVETVLVNGEVDAAAIWEPTVTRLVDKGTAKILATGDDCGLLGVNGMVARQAFVEENPFLAKVVVEQFQKGIEAMEDADPEIWAKVAEDLTLDEEQLTAVSEKFAYKVDVAQEDIDGLNDTIEFLVSIGVLTEAFDFAPYVNQVYQPEA